jgi:zinc transport system ATP-binding protein
MSTTAVLEVDHLSVRLGAHLIINDLSFRVQEASTLAIIGPNGAGKTVLFKALIGALPLEGAVRWAPGTRIGYVPQKLDVERDLPITGLDFLHARAAVSRGAMREADRALELVGLPREAASEPIGALAGGHFQRLLLAFALMGHPTVLLFDEPTAGVDEPGEADIYATVRRLQEEERLTLLLISHELNLVNRYATNVLCLSRRRPCFGPPIEILTPERLQEAFGTATRYHLHEDV